METQPRSDSAATVPLLPANSLVGSHLQDVSALSTPAILLITNIKETQSIAHTPPPRSLSSPRPEVSVAILTNSKVHLLRTDGLNWEFPNCWTDTPTPGLRSLTNMTLGDLELPGPLTVM